MKSVDRPYACTMAFHGISDLKAIRKYNWKIKVRVLSKWCERNAFSGRRNGLNLILIAEAVSIHIYFTLHVVKCFTYFPFFFNTEFKIIYLFFKNDRVHAWMGETTLRYFDKIFLEGHAYVIKNFIVKYYEPSDINRCFKDEQHIILSCSTRAYPLKEEIGNIPFNGWKFTDLGKLNDFDDNINHFIGEICKFSLLNQFIDTYDPYISPSYLFLYYI